MSVYAIHKLLWLSEEDPEFRARLQSDPDEAMKGFALTTDEVQALKIGFRIGRLERNALRRLDLIDR